MASQFVSARDEQKPRQELHFLRSAAVILLLTAAAKFASAFGTQSILEKADPIFWVFKNRELLVLVATLDLSAKCRAFDEVTTLLPFATKVEKCPAVCPVCGNDAYYTAKLSNDDREIEVGGKNLYEPRCFRHHPIMCNPNETVG